MRAEVDLGTFPHRKAQKLAERLSATIQECEDPRVIATEMTIEAWDYGGAGSCIELAGNCCETELLRCFALMMAQDTSIGL